MRRSLQLGVVASLLCFLVLVLSPLQAQQVVSPPGQAPAAANPTPAVPVRDPQAVTLLAQCLRAMGGNAPMSVVQIGTVDIVAGSTRDSGTIKILTRNLDQTLEEISTSSGQERLVYSRMRATHTEGGLSKPLSLELTVTSQTPYSPLVLVARALSDPTVSAQYVALESHAGLQAHHIRILDTFSGKNPMFFNLSVFSTRDIWVDASTGLPISVAYDEKPSSGPSPSIHFEVAFSDFRPVSGGKFPFLITKTFNGSLYLTIHITSIALNSGLADADFPLN